MNETQSRTRFASVMLCAAVLLGIETTAGSETQAQKLEWATSADGEGDPLRGDAIATDARGNSYVSGYFQGTATFGASEANETVIEAVGESDVFVAKYRSDGTLLWATSAGGDNFDASLANIATDARQQLRHR